jgi:hypothetical protein
MLYDPKWDHNSLTGLRDWLATQNPEEVYRWHDCRNCAVGKYLTAHGVDPGLNYSFWIENTPGANAAVHKCFPPKDGPILCHWHAAAKGGGRETTTLGGALKRLDAWMLAHYHSYQPALKTNAEAS